MNIWLEEQRILRYQLGLIKYFSVTFLSINNDTATCAQHPLQMYVRYV